MNPIIRFAVAALSASLFVMSGIARAADDAAPATRIFFIGNSVTDQVSYDAFAAIAKDHGHPVEYGRHMIPGAPLVWLWTHEDGFKGKYGSGREALANYQWDVITLQPFDRGLHDGTADKPEGDLDICQLYINTAKPRSPDAQVYIYERWPRICKNGRGFNFDKDAYKDATGQIDLRKVDGVDDFSKLWSRTYGLRKWDGSEESRDYFEKLTLALRKQNPDMKKTVKLIPVGDVMNELHQMMQAGKVPGYTSIFQMYADGIHLNETGRYIVGCTFYATIFKADPHGLPSEPYKVKDTSIVPVIQDVVWKTVQENKLAGIATDPTTHP
jgi:hypothetical protein